MRYFLDTEFMDLSNKQTIAICIAVYLIIPVLGVIISGRKLSKFGWIAFTVLWPIAWLWGPEELP